MNACLGRVQKAERIVPGMMTGCSAELPDRMERTHD